MRIAVNTAEAIAKLESNFTAHKEEYQKQLAGWQEKMKEFSEALSAWAASGGKDGERPAQPSRPDKFDREYRRYIYMLKTHTVKFVEIEDHEFDQIFMDKFSWKHAFAVNSSTYTGNGLSAAEDDEEYDDEP